jgi:GAF domain-containing protein
VLFEDEVKAVIELASLGHFTALHLAFLDQLTASIGILLNSIEATMQTEGLLVQSQQLATELQTQQRELQQTNEQLAQKAQQLAEQNAEVERKNREIEEARRAVEEKATELALTSKYKSEFLANMSHELRTPLNSILILAQQLADNVEGNLTHKQGEFARTIHGAGTDLLNLITDILDLSKIESGTVTVMAEEVVLGSLLEGIARPFRVESESRRLSFDVELDPSLAGTIVTDAKRLQQVLKNLLSNAVKFTEQGAVRLTVSPAEAAGAAPTRCSTGPPTCWPSRSPIRASASRPRSSASSSRRSSRPMPVPAASTAAPAWDLPSAASWPSCSAARSSCAARPGWAARSRSSFRCLRGSVGQRAARAAAGCRTAPLALVPFDRGDPGDRA